MNKPTVLESSDGLGYFLHRECSCGTITYGYVTNEEMLARQQGAFVQDAFPSLSADEREALFLSGICSTCFASLYSEE